MLSSESRKWIYSEFNGRTVSGELRIDDKWEIQLKHGTKEARISCTKNELQKLQDFLIPTTVYAAMRNVIWE